MFTISQLRKYNLLLRWEKDFLISEDIIRSSH